MNKLYKLFIEYSNLIDGDDNLNHMKIFDDGSGCIRRESSEGKSKAETVIDFFSIKQGIKMLQEKIDKLSDP